MLSNDFKLRKILIIEDQADNRESWQSLFQILGFAVEVASDGRTGVEKAVSWGPDVIVSDIGLPDIDGYEVARRVRALLGNDVILIALTAYGQAEDKNRAIAAGFTFHLTKPADVDSLLHLLN